MVKIYRDDKEIKICDSIKDALSYILGRKLKEYSWYIDDALNSENIMTITGKGISLNQEYLKKYKWNSRLNKWIILSF